MLIVYRNYDLISSWCHMPCSLTYLLMILVVVRQHLIGSQVLILFAVSCLIASFANRISLQIRMSLLLYFGTIIIGEIQSVGHSFQSLLSLCFVNEKLCYNAYEQLEVYNNQYGALYCDSLIYHGYLM